MTFVLLGTERGKADNQESALSVDADLRSAGLSVLPVSLGEVLTSVKAICLGGGHLDCVVLAVRHDTEDLRSALKIATALRDLDDLYVLQACVRARTLPLIILVPPSAPRLTSHFRNPSSHDITLAGRGFKDQEELLRAIDSLLWCTRVSLGEDDLVTSLIQCLADWKRTLLQELDRIGFAITRNDLGEYQVSQALVRRRAHGDILADEATPGSLRANQFLLLGSDFVEQSRPYLVLRDLLNSYRDIALSRRIKPETVFQEFFEANPTLISSGFERVWAKPRLSIPEEGRHFNEPDFVFGRMQGAHLGPRLKVVDLKLPEAALLTGARLHKTISKALVEAIGQLHDYRDYFNRPDLRHALQEHFGVPPANPKLAVLIGRMPDEEAQERLVAQQEKMGCLDIEVLPYDAVLDDEAKRIALKLRFLRLVDAKW